ncbi:MAG TPA: SDR family oxidoreductase, partial [Dehalococcoidia bacterium]|nr:SDR family oxidoreductase [Dehalococcoidia bacterium]
TELSGNPNAMAETMDITSDEQIERVYKAAMSRFGTIDVIINNAAMRARDLYAPTGTTEIIDTSVQDWIRMFDTNVFGAFRVVKQFAQPMLTQRHGSIIVLGSEGRGGVTQEGPYQPSKAAQTEMTRFLAHELKPYNIAANVLMPGFTRTTGSDEQMAARVAPGASPPALRRLRPEAAVPLALFLAEQDAGGITGESLAALRWNEEHGLGGFAAWGYAGDVDAARAAGRL